MYFCHFQRHYSDRLQMGIFTELSILYSKYRPGKRTYGLCISLHLLIASPSHGAPQTLRVTDQHSKGVLSSLIQRHTRSHWLRQVIKATEKAHLWPELVFLYIKYDEFVRTPCLYCAST